MEKPKAGSRLGAILGGSFAMLVAVYFLLPVVFMVPLAWAVERGSVSQDVEMKLAAPVRYLEDRVVAYEQLVNLEMEYCERKLWLPFHD